MKKYLPGTIAAVLALGISAFTVKPKPAAFANKFFKYLDYPIDLLMNDPNRYELSTTTFCPGGMHRCGVFAPSNGLNPERPILTGSSVIVKTKN